MGEDAGGLDWGLNLDTGQTDPKLQRIATGVQNIKKHIKETGVETVKMGEQMNRGFEHGLHHIQRHLGLGGLMLGAGAGGFLASAGLEAMAKTYESYKQYQEKMKKDYEDSVKESNKQTTAGGSTSGITSKRAYQLYTNSGGRFTQEEAATIGGKISNAYRGATNNQLIEGIVAVKESKPTAEGTPELSAKMAELGIPAERLGALVEASGNRPKELAELLDKVKRRIKSRKYNAGGYAWEAAHSLDAMKPEKALSNLGRMSAEDFEKSGKTLENYHPFQSDEIQAQRDADFVETSKKNQQVADAKKSGYAEKMRVNKIFMEAYPQMFTAKRIDELMDKYGSKDIDSYQWRLMAPTATMLQQKGMPTEESKRLVEKMVEKNSDTSEKLHKTLEKTARSFENDASQQQ